MADVRDEIQKRLDNVHRAMGGQVQAAHNDIKRCEMLIKLYQKKYDKALEELDQINEVTSPEHYEENLQRVRNLQIKVELLEEAKAQNQMVLDELGRKIDS